MYNQSTNTGEFDISQLEAELAVTDAEIQRHLNTPEWAYAMGHGCAIDGSHPTLVAIRHRVARLVERKKDLKARISEFSNA